MKIALLGPTGQIGQAIMRALLTTTPHHVLQIAAPQSESSARDQVKSFTSDQSQRLSTAVVDLLSATPENLTPHLTGVEIVISALNGKALAAQRAVQDAAAHAGVKRFYPSEYGMHHIYRPPGEDDQMGYLHPIWNLKSTTTEQCLHHPAILAGKMSYTLIGCGDFYNQSRETTWCPWVNPDPPDTYTLHILGDADAKVDFTHIDDLAAFLVETVQHPEISANRTLNFVSDRISYNEIAALLERFSSRTVKKEVWPLEVMHRVWRDPEGAIPPEVKGKSVFPDDFWILVKGMQGAGRSVRPPGEVHNGLFPGVEVRTFERYFGKMFGEKDVEM
ncbi:NAD(P)-binding protein [Aspergillus fijiensis CBS 313.89]|uniref:NAD(P)-binding protein n=1 Tax=Aspergillus fijiensis CBS 313.89 TaxID=1448319 RepID=A0A8G1VY96_9EURO|nr:NAD(P)-binding protein [Aspergillus fijiensis CBS 313.89]RAK73804.1 NAD(P)-binding protein [Aspergillus fijiensis CBS 313.89]